MQRTAILTFGMVITPAMHQLFMKIVCYYNFVVISSNQHRDIPLALRINFHSQNQYESLTVNVGLRYHIIPYVLRQRYNYRNLIIVFRYKFQSMFILKSL